MKTRKLLIFRPAKNAQYHKIALNWNVSGTQDFRLPTIFRFFESALPATFSKGSAIVSECAVFRPQSTAKLNESRQVVKIVDSEADLLRSVEATPGAVGIVDVYSINSSVKVLRVGGKLPFDVGYALKGIQ